MNLTHGISFGESEGLCDPNEIQGLVEKIIRYHNYIKRASETALQFTDTPGEVNMWKYSARRMAEEVELAGGAGIRFFSDTTLLASECNRGALEFITNLHGARIIRIYGIEDRYDSYLPPTGERFDRFLSSIAREDLDKDMVVAVPAEDHRDGHVLYSVYPGGFAQLTVGNPITCSIDFSEDFSIFDN